MSLTCSPRAPDPVLAGHPQTRAPQKGVTAKLVPTVYLQLDGFRKKKMSNSLNLDANLEPGKIFQIQESFKNKKKRGGGYGGAWPRSNIS